MMHLSESNDQFLMTFSIVLRLDFLRPRRVLDESSTSPRRGDIFYERKNENQGTSRVRVVWNMERHR